MLDRNQVIKHAFIPEDARLRFVVIGEAADPQDPHTLDEAQIWKRVFDPETQSLRVVTVPE